MALNTTGLNQAYLRKQAGTANAQDLANLNYAGTKGWTYQAPTPTPSNQNITPAPKPADPNASYMNSLNGVDLNTAQSLYQAKNTLTQADKDKVLADLGIPQLEATAFANPTTTQEALYNQKYGELGLSDLKSKIDTFNSQIAAKKDALNNAIGAVNENPWLTESMRVGQARRLQELANADINNLIEQQNLANTLYNNSLSEVNNYVTRSMNDQTAQRTAASDKLNYLNQIAQNRIAQAQAEKNAGFANYAPALLQNISQAEYMKAGYTPISNPAQLKGLKESDILRVGGQIYKKPAAEISQIIEANGRKVGIDKSGNVVKDFGAVTTPVKGTGAGASAPSAGIVSTPNGESYDIASYATDPTHEVKIQGIMNSMGQMKTIQDMDAYIQRVAPGSPVTGQMIANAAAKYGVSWEMMMAIMQQDSSFGTAGKAVRTFNPGNVGNTDSGATVNYKTWQAGVEAVAKNLAWRKQAGTTAVSQAANDWAKAITNKTAKMSDVPKEMKSQVASALDQQSGGQVTLAEQNRAEALALVNDMINDPNRTSATGVSAWTSKIPATGAKTFANKADRLVGLLTLDAIKMMKGMGALSDAEGRRLEQSMSLLKDRYISEADYLAELQRVQKMLSKASTVMASQTPNNGTLSSGLSYTITND